MTSDKDTGRSSQIMKKVKKGTKKKKFNLPKGSDIGDPERRARQKAALKQSPFCKKV